MVIFQNREEAGKVLALEFQKLKPQPQNPLVLGIPRGGIPVGYYVAKSQRAPLDTIVLRKLPLPDNPEAGFGAVTIDKTTVFNDILLSRLNLTSYQKGRIVDRVYKEVVRRDKVYRKGLPFPFLENRSVILTDDGLASGFTMLAAIQFARKKNAAKIIVAVPVAHREAFDIVNNEADAAVVLHISGLPYFAVASFYKEFPDMTDEEVVAYLEKARQQ